MPNMSYCRFQNTLTDMHDCMDHLDDPASGSGFDRGTLSPEEADARDEFVKLCLKVAEQVKNGFIDQYVERDEDGDED